MTGKSRYGKQKNGLQIRKFCNAPEIQEVGLLARQFST